MKIDYKENYIPNINELLCIYGDAGWLNYTKKPTMLENAYKNSLFVLTAWENEKLVGTIRVVGDGYSIIYIQDIIVSKAFHRQGIGSELLKRVINKYKDVYQTVLLTDNDIKTVQFYKNFGLETSDKFGCVSFVSFAS